MLKAALPCLLHLTVDQLSAFMGRLSQKPLDFMARLHPQRYFDAGFVSDLLTCAGLSSTQIPAQRAAQASVQDDADRRHHQELRSAC